MISERRSFVSLSGRDLRHMYLPTAEFTDNELYGGNRLPYAPKHTFGVIFGVRQFGGLTFQIDLNAVAEQFGDNRQTVAPSVDGTVGQLPSYQVANLAIGYEIRRERWLFEPYFTIKNAFDEIYIIVARAARHPAGPVPTGERRPADQFLGTPCFEKAVSRDS